LHLSRLFEAVKSGPSKPQSATDQNLLRLKGWDLELIRSLLSRGRGLIICSFRIGAIRFVPVDLALQGFPTSQMLNQLFYEGLQPVFDSLGPAPWEEPPIPGESTPQADNIRLLKILYVEDPHCTVGFVDALKRNEVVVFCFEGNSGVDGPWGNTSKSTIDFMGHKIAVKNGTARLSAALKTPILPVIVRRDGDASGQIVFGEPIIPPAGLKYSEHEKFSQTTMQSLYALMEAAVLPEPEQWEGWSALHRWRLCDDVDASRHELSNADAQTIARLLREGKRFSVNRHRVAQLPTKDGVMWVNLKTLKGFLNPKWTGEENVLATLSSPCGLDLAWINRGNNSDPAWEEKICLLLAYLQQSDLIAAH
jgi:hypothetical protein